jgi:C4-type Zn-finger protein
MFKKCAVCGLLLPITVMSPIQVRHQGRIITVVICNPCKQRKESESKGENK